MGYQKTYRIIKPKKWYLVDTFRSDIGGKTRILKKEYDNRKQAQQNIDRIIKEKEVHKLRFDVIKGQDAIDLGVYILNAYPNLNMYLRKYKYENYMVSDQAKKSYRTKFRRHNRQKRGELHKKWG